MYIKGLLCLLVVISVMESKSAVDWSSVDKVITDAINGRAFPGAVLGVGTSK